MSLNNSLEGLRQINLSDLDFNNVGSWPAAIKFIARLFFYSLALLRS